VVTSRHPSSMMLLFYHMQHASVPTFLMRGMSAPLAWARALFRSVFPAMQVIWRWISWLPFVWAGLSFSLRY
jgi:hypothetical protein